MRHREKESPYKLQKYVFHGVLYSFVLNDTMDGGTFFQDFREAQLRFQRRGIFSVIQSIFILASFHLLTPSFTFLDQEACAAL